MTDALIVDRCRELATLIDRHTDGKGDGFHQTRIAPLGFGRESLTGRMRHGVSTPMLAIVVQGKKVQRWVRKSIGMVRRNIWLFQSINRLADLLSKRPPIAPI